MSKAQNGRLGPLFKLLPFLAPKEAAYGLYIAYNTDEAASVARSCRVPSPESS